MAKDFFNRSNVTYSEKNVEEDPKAADEMMKKSGQMGVPVIEIGDAVIIGFDEQAIRKALGLK